MYIIFWNGTTKHIGEDLLSIMRDTVVLQYSIITT